MKCTDPLYIPNLKNYKGFKNDDVRFIPTGLDALDALINDLATKEVTVITGRTKEGKSTFIHRIMLNAIDNGFKVLLIDGEHNRTFLINQLYRMVIGGEPHTYNAVRYNKKTMYQPKPLTLELLNNWHKDKLTIFTKYISPIKDLNELFQFTETYVKTFGIDLVIYDNLMTLVDGTQVERNENQSQFMKRVVDMAKGQNVHCIVAAHPNKESKSTPLMNVYDVSGSSDIVNLCSNLIQVMRSYDPEEPYDGLVRLMLNRLYGDIADIPVQYEAKRNCLFQMSNINEPMTYEFNWKGEGEQDELSKNGFERLNA